MRAYADEVVEHFVERHRMDAGDAKDYSAMLALGLLHYLRADMSVRRPREKIKGFSENFLYRFDIEAAPGDMSRISLGAVRLGKELERTQDEAVDYDRHAVEYYTACMTFMTRGLLHENGLKAQDDLEAFRSQLLDKCMQQLAHIESQEEGMLEAGIVAATRAAVLDAVMQAGNLDQWSAANVLGESDVDVQMEEAIDKLADNLRLDSGVRVQEEELSIVELSDAFTKLVAQHIALNLQDIASEDVSDVAEFLAEHLPVRNTLGEFTRGDNLREFNAEIFRLSGENEMLKVMCLGPQITDVMEQVNKAVCTAHRQWNGYGAPTRSQSERAR